MARLTRGAVIHAANPHRIITEIPLEMYALSTVDRTVA
jgi:hypothetical protein